MLKGGSELRDVQSRLLYARCCLDLKEYVTVIVLVCLCCSYMFVLHVGIKYNLYCMAQHFSSRNYGGLLLKNILADKHCWINCYV